MDRPPQVVRRPCRVPLSLFIGATPSIEYALIADRRVFVRVIFNQCASSCDEVESAECEVAQVEGILEVSATAETSNSVEGDCPSACQVIDTVCAIEDPLPAGDYVLDYAGETRTVTVPVRDDGCEP